MDMAIIVAANMAYGHTTLNVPPCDKPYCAERERERERDSLREEAALCVSE